MPKDEWITAGYDKYLKRQKRKHNPTHFKRFVTKKFGAQGIDVRMVSNAFNMMLELFWQTETLKIALVKLFALAQFQQDCISKLQKERGKR